MAATIEFPKKLVISGNIALAAWIILDTAGLLLINLGAGVAYFILALIAVYGVLKFLGCLRPCYNCKKCTFGMGRLAALYFGNCNLKDYKETYHLPVALFYYIFLGPFPAAILAFYTFQSFSIFKFAMLLVLLTFSMFSALTWRSDWAKEFNA